MREVERIAEQLQRAYDGDAWFGSPVRAALEGVEVADAERISEKIGDVRDRALGSGVSVYVTLHGLAQHHAYHAGQIALLKRALQGGARA